MNSIRPKKNIELIYAAFSARVFIVGLILSVTFFLFLIDSNKLYQSEISIMVSTKSELAVRQQAQIVSNITELPKTLAFYDRMLKLNPDVRDVAAGKSAEKRKAAWNEMLTVQRANLDASVIKISITASRETDAVQLVEKTVRTLFDTTAFYYNVKNDVDLRIIDGPITRVGISNWFWLLLVSVIVACAVSWFLQYFIFSDKKIFPDRPKFLKASTFFDFKKNPEMPIEKELESLNRLYESDQPEESFIFEHEIEGKKESLEKNNTDLTNQEKFDEIKKVTKKLEPGKYPNFPEMPVEPKKSASAPDNLPIADSSYFEQPTPTQKEIQIEQIPIEEKSIPETIKEPTPEQLKERLNQLLRGKI